MSEAIHSIDPERLPKHLSIIMDGNGRWAKAQGKPRTYGHEMGVKTVKKIVEACVRWKIAYLTLYTFSTENWNRPQYEVDLLMRLLVKSLKKELPTFIENNVRLGAIGSLEALPGSAQKELKEVIEATSQHTGMTLTLALSYGAREELTQAMRQIADKVKNNIIKPEDIDQACINTNLYTCDLPDVDLLIRTSGEQRISNFLLWQIAYAELYFTEVFWPEFDENALENAFLSYQHRERRFGKTSEQVQS